MNAFWKALLAIVVASASVQAAQYFQYDKADEVVHSTTLENPLAYDSSVIASDGKLFLTWLEFQPAKGDVIFFGIREGDKWLDKKAVVAQPGDYANPTLTRARNGDLWLTYEAATGSNWNIFATKQKPDGTFSKPIQISTAKGANINHRTASDAKGIWIVWQADNKGQFDIYARQIPDSLPTSNFASHSPIQISDSPRGDWHPSIAVTKSGNVFVAWDSYDGTSYNIRVRECDLGVTWRPIMTVTSSENFNANVSLAAGETNAWLCWEEDGPNWGKAYKVRTDAKKNSQRMSDDIGSVHRFRKLHLAEVAPDTQSIREFIVPQKSFAQAAQRTDAPAGIKQLGVFYQSPELTTDARGRLWLVYRHFYMPLMGITQSTHVQADWGIYARCLDEGVWSRVFRFDHGQGDALQRINISPNTNGISIAYTFGRTDRRNPQNWQEDALAPEKVVPHVSKKRVPNAESAPLNDDSGIPSSGRGVAFATVSLMEANQMKYSYFTGKPTINPLQPGDQNSVAPKPNRPSFDFNGKHYELYYGDFHRHTDISLCFWPGDGTMDDAYRYGIDAAPLDFLGITDHTHDIAMGDPLSLIWHRIRKEVNRHALEGKFIPFYSYERSRGDTDHNVISLRDDILRPHTYPHSEFWKELDTNTFTIPHQPFNSVLWKTNDRDHRPLMEIYQGFRNHTCESDATNGLAHNNEVGFIASSDHLSTGASFACVWAEQPTRESIFAALKARRTYAAMDKTFLVVTCGDHWMGEKFQVSKSPTIVIAVKPAEGEITKLEAYVDGIARELPLDEMFLGQFAYRPKLPKGKHVIFIRVSESNGNFAWSSPMWLDIKP